MTDHGVTYTPDRYGFGHALRIQARIIFAIILREARVRYGHSKISYLWALFEPIMHVAVLLGIYRFMHRQSPVGGSLPLFFITGLFAYLVFSKTASKVGQSITANKHVLSLPTVSNVDVMLARGLLEFATLIFVMILLLFCLYCFRIESANPMFPLTFMTGMVATWLLGMGVGIFNAVLSAMWHSWSHVFTAITRPVYLLSGVFFSVERIPDPLRSIMLYNPVLHANEWIRAGFFENYGRFSLDKFYLIAWCLSTLVLGLGLEKLLRRKLYAVA